MELRTLARRAVARYLVTRRQSLAAIAARLARVHGLDDGDELADAVQAEYARRVLARLRR